MKGLKYFRALTKGFKVNKNANVAFLIIFLEPIKEAENPKQSPFFIIKGTCYTTRVKETNAEFEVPGSG